LAHFLYPEYPQDIPATASSAIGIAQAAMGCSHEVYNVCKDVYDFIKARFSESTIRHRRLKLNVKRKKQLLPLIPPRFPTFLETLLAQYDLEERTEAQNQRLWPTKPESAGGFYFLLV